ncbi:MAG: hypothetical protein E7080_03670 [Bacteroidales bacterium]|nr:hypothetical protein [Bacteroidales bacterium]
MKKIKFLFLSILAMVWLSACSESDEPTSPETDVEIAKLDSILLGDEFVEVNMNFTEEDLQKALQGNKWQNNPVFPYIYDAGVAKRIDFGKDNLNMPQPEHYSFDKNGKMTISGRGYEDIISSYQVSNKTLRFDYVTADGEECFEDVEVLSLTKDMIIFDRKYNEYYLSESNKELNKWFNPETAKFRYVWRIYKEYPEGCIFYPDGTVIYPDGTIGKY